jgi:hypothetical protein
MRGVAAAIDAGSAVVDLTDEGADSARHELDLRSVWDGVGIAPREAGNHSGLLISGKRAKTVGGIALGAGIVDVPQPGGNWEDWDIAGAAVDGEGRIVTAAFLREYDESSQGGWNLGITRFNGDGTLDGSFGTAGSVFLSTEVMNDAAPVLAESEKSETPPPDADDDVIAAMIPTAPYGPLFSMATIETGDSPVLGTTPERSLLGQFEDDALFS